MIDSQEFIWSSLRIEFMGCWLGRFVGLDSWFMGFFFAVFWGPIFSLDQFQAFTPMDSEPFNSPWANFVVPAWTNFTVEWAFL